MKTFRTLLFAAVAVLALGAGAQFAAAQPSSTTNAITPMTRDIGSIRTLTAAVAGTYNSADQNGFNVARMVCVYRQSAHVGSPSTTVAIQNKDQISGQYYSLITSSAISSDSTNPIYAGAGVPASANVSAGLPIAQTWRVQVVVSGTTSVTGTVGCSVQ